MYYTESGFKCSGGISMNFFFGHQEDAYMYYMESGFKYSGGTSMNFSHGQSSGPQVLCSYPHVYCCLCILLSMCA